MHIISNISSFLRQKNVSPLSIRVAKLLLRKFYLENCYADFTENFTFFFLIHAIIGKIFDGMRKGIYLNKKWIVESILLPSDGVKFFSVENVVLARQRI